jgi:hypothetical protein
MAGKKTVKKSGAKSNGEPDQRKYAQRPYPQRTLEEALQIAQKIKEKNGGNPWRTEDVAKACGYTNISSAGFFYLAAAGRDYGLTVGTNRTEKIEIAPLGREILYAGNAQSERENKIKAFFNIDVFKQVYLHYGGSKSLPPEQTYLSNTLQKDFGLEPDLHEEFIKLFKANCQYLGIEDGLGGLAVVPIGKTAEQTAEIRVVGEPKGKFDRTAFVIMPFSEKGKLARPVGFFDQVLRSLITPAGNKAGFAVQTAERHGSDIIQSTIINQLLEAELIIVDLTDHNPNVFFELGIRIHAQLPVALIRAEGTDRTFDVDNLMRVFPYNPNLWPTTIEVDLSKMTDHIKAAWDNRSTQRTYMEILTGKPRPNSKPSVIAERTTASEGK